MIDLDITFFIQLVNFLIIWMVLNLILYRPIRGIIKKRSEYMAGQVSSIEKFNAQAVTKVKDYEAALDVARKAGVDERSRLKVEAQASEAEIVGNAGREAASKISAARAEIESQVKKAMQSLQSEVDRMAKKATDKILA